MNFEKLAPWNWFKNEDEQKGAIVPVRHSSGTHGLPVSLHDLHNEFNRFFDSLKHSFGEEVSNDFISNSNWLKPSLDIASDDKEYTIKVELPGMDASDISIEFTDSILKINGEKRQEKEEKGKDFYRIERSYGSFERILDIPENSDTDNITSNYKNGVLSISIPKKALPQKDTKKIEVKAE